MKIQGWKFVCANTNQTVLPTNVLDEYSNVDLKAKRPKKWNILQSACLIQESTRDTR